MDRERLEKPFEPGQVKQRQGNFGHILNYVEGHAVIKRLNDVFDANWTFELVNHWVLDETDEVLVLGKLTAEGITKMAYGSKEIARNKDTKAVISLGDDIKAASTDALKKAASLLGIGLYLYANSRSGEKEERHPKESGNESMGNEKGNQPGNGGGNGTNGRLTNKQLAAIFSIGKSKGMDNKEIKEKALTIFNKNLDFLTKEEASSLIKNLLME